MAWNWPPLLSPASSCPCYCTNHGSHFPRSSFSTLLNKTCFMALKNTTLILELDFVPGNLNIHKIIIKEALFETSGNVKSAGHCFYVEFAEVTKIVAESIYERNREAHKYGSLQIFTLRSSAPKRKCFMRPYRSRPGVGKLQPTDQPSLLMWGLRGKNDFYILTVLFKHTKRKRICTRDVCGLQCLTYSRSGSGSLPPL